MINLREWEHMHSNGREGGKGRNRRWEKEGEWRRKNTSSKVQRYRLWRSLESFVGIVTKAAFKFEFSFLGKELTPVYGIWVTIHPESQALVQGWRCLKIWIISRYKVERESMETICNPLGPLLYFHHHPSDPVS